MDAALAALASLAFSTTAEAARLATAPIHGGMYYCCSVAYLGTNTATTTVLVTGKRSVITIGMAYRGVPTLSFSIADGTGPGKRRCTLELRPSEVLVLKQVLDSYPFHMIKSAETQPDVTEA